MGSEYLAVGTVLKTRQNNINNKKKKKKTSVALFVEIILNL